MSVIAAIAYSTMSCNLRCLCFCLDLTEGFGLEGRSYCPVGKIFNGVHVVVMDDDFNVKSIGDPGEVIK